MRLWRTGTLTDSGRSSGRPLRRHFHKRLLGIPLPLFLCFAQEERLRRVRKFHTSFFKLLLNSEVNLLLNIHILVVVSPINIIHDLKDETKIAIRREVCTVKSCIINIFNNIPDYYRYFL